MTSLEVGGIPETIFQQNLENQPIKGLNSGEYLMCTTQPTHIDIWRINNPNFNFSADVDYGVLTLSVHTKVMSDGKVIHDPDLFAARLFRRAMEYFFDQNVQIDVIQGRWSGKIESLSDNYQEYIDGRERGLTSTQSALQTWTGKRASEFDYTDVEVTESDEAVNVSFWKNTKSIESVA